MYFDTPRDFIGGVYDELLYGDQPLGWDIIGTKETVRGATRETFLATSTAGTSPERMVVGVGGKIEGDLMRDARELLGDMRARRDRRARAGRAARERRRPSRRRCTRSSPTRRTSMHRRALSYPLQPSRPLRAAAADDRARRRACRRGSSPRCASGAASRTTSSATTTSYTDAGSLYAQAGVDINRIDEAVTTIVAELRKLAEEPVPRTSSRRRGTSPRAGSSSSSRARTGRSCSACAARCSRAARPSPQEVLAALDEVTAEDVQRVAQDVIGRNGAEPRARSARSTTPSGSRSCSTRPAFASAGASRGRRGQVQRGRRGQTPVPDTLGLGAAAPAGVAVTAETGPVGGRGWHLSGSARQSAFNCSGLGDDSPRSNELMADADSLDQHLRVAEARHSSGASASSLSSSPVGGPVSTFPTPPVRGFRPGRLRLVGAVYQAASVIAASERPEQRDKPTRERVRRARVRSGR